MLDWIKSSADWLAVTFGGLVVLGIVGRWIVKRVRRWSVKLEQVREVLVGREEIRHPDSGRVLVDATPGIGMRLATIEETLVVLGSTDRGLQELGQKVGELADQLGQHVTEANELELARTREREEMWHAIQAVATPNSWDGNERRAT